MFAMQDKILLLVPEPLREDTLRTFEKFQINTVPRCLHFISQCWHESQGFTKFEENLNYSADGLLRTFKKYFPDKATALTYERKPIAIASRVYANRMGNGDEASRDGWTYRGGGGLHTTGKYNYGRFSNEMGIDFVADPDKLRKEYPISSAGFFWFDNKLNEIADKGLIDEVIEKVTRKVNGGLNGIKDRTEILDNLCKQIMVTR
jgi:putative chitinase